MLSLRIIYHTSNENILKIIFKDGFYITDKIQTEHVFYGKMMAFYKIKALKLARILKKCTVIFKV